MPRPSVLSSLTERERLVVELSARGIPLKVIAFDLAVSVQTVSTHLARARRKLTAASRSDLAELVIGQAPSLDRIPRNVVTTLSPAESIIITALLRGHSNRRIAQERGTSVRTTEHQVARLLTKINVASRYELIALAAAERADVTDHLDEVGKTPI
jgi:DNA-binding NarL/FixJ family response regulator